MPTPRGRVHARRRTARWVASSVAIGISLLASACGSDGNASGPAATSTPASTVTTTAVTTTTAAAPTTTRGPSSYPIPGVLAAGTYRVRLFDPTFVFDVVTGDALDGYDAVGPDHFDVLGRDFDRLGSYFGAMRVSRVFTEFEVRDPMQTNAVGKVAPVPSDLVAWLRSVPGLQVSEPESLQIAGRPARRVSVSTAKVASGRGGCSSRQPCYPLFLHRDGVSYFSIGAGDTEVLTVIDMADGVPLVFAVGGTDAAFVTRAHQLLAAARIG